MVAKKLTCLSCGQLNSVPEERLMVGPKCGVCGEPLMPTKPVEVDPATLQKAAKNDDVPLVVDFWAPWCGPCRMMAPEFSRAAGELKGKARLAKLNTENYPDAGQRNGIRGIPTMVGYAGGRERKRQSGAMRSGDITRWVESI